MSFINKIRYSLLPEKLKKKWSYEDFLYYRMQEVPFRSIESFATEEELWEYEKKLNSDEERIIFNDKREFLKRFAPYIKRDWLILNDSNEHDFLEFCKKHEKVILKPCDMYAGIGIEIYDERIHKFDELAKKKYIAEEYVNQAEKYANIYSGSLNTMRVTTLIDSCGNPQILFAVNQFGSGGSIVDNDDGTAIWAAIDVETGKVFAADVDTKTGIVYEKHPDTGADILGFENICWGEVKKLALTLSTEVKNCRLIGWDIAITRDCAPELIEGNVTPELDLYQRMTKRGLRTQIEEKIH